MADPILTQRWLERTLTAQAGRAVLFSGTGRSLVLLWVLGVGALAVAFKAPALALLLTLALGADADHRVLSRIAAAAHGKYWKGETATDLSRIYQEIATYWWGRPRRP